MSFLSIQKFQVIFEKKLSHVQLQTAFKNFQKKYKASFNFDSYTNIIERINKTNRRESQKNHFQLVDKEENKAESFVFGEFKIFTWVLVVYCYNLNIALEELNYQHFTEIQTIFQNKSLIFIKYETLCLMHEKQKFEKEWTQQEIQSLTNIIALKNTPKQWRIISFELFKQSKGGFYRPFQQCRQKWFNYLDPKVNRGEWTQAEDIALLTAAQFLGCKWAVISRQLDGVRTEHMVKNRYKSLISKWKRKFKKTNPQKLVSYILKQLKKKNEKNEEMLYHNSIDHSEIFQQESQVLDMIKQQQKNQIKNEVQVSQSVFRNQHKAFIAEGSKIAEEQEFDLGVNNIEEQKEWGIQDQKGNEKLLVNYMRYRTDNFQWQLEEKEQRKTSDNEQSDNKSHQQNNKQEQESLYVSQNYGLFDFPVQNYFQPNGGQSPSLFWTLQNGVESEWFRNLQLKNSLSWIDESD